MGCLRCVRSGGVHGNPISTPRARRRGASQMLKGASDRFTGHLALAGSGLGLVGGLLLMPTDTLPAGAVSPSAIVLTVGLLAGTIYGVAGRGFGRAVRADHLILFA